MPEMRMAQFVLNIILNPFSAFNFFDPQLSENLLIGMGFHIRIFAILSSQGFIAEFNNTNFAPTLFPPASRAQK